MGNQDQTAQLAGCQSRPQGQRASERGWEERERERERECVCVCVSFCLYDTERKSHTRSQQVQSDVSPQEAEALHNKVKMLARLEENQYCFDCGTRGESLIFLFSLKLFSVIHTHTHTLSFLFLRLSLSLSHSVFLPVSFCLFLSLSHTLTRTRPGVQPWASWNLGVFLCWRCAGIHRSLGLHVSKVCVSVCLCMCVCVCVCVFVCVCVYVCLSRPSLSDFSSRQSQLRLTHGLLTTLRCDTHTRIHSLTHPRNKNTHAHTHTHTHTHTDAPLCSRWSGRATRRALHIGRPRCRVTLNALRRRLNWIDSSRRNMSHAR